MKTMEAPGGLVQGNPTSAARAADGEVDEEVGRTSSLEQVKQCLEEFKTFGVMDSSFRLGCDLEASALNFLIESLEELDEKPTELELDLCTFPKQEVRSDEDGNDAVEDDSLALLVTKLMHLLPLKVVEVENRLLERPWSSQTVSVFLEKGHLHRLNKLTLYGVDLRGAEIGQSFERLFCAGNSCKTLELKLSELSLSYCPVDKLTMTRFCPGLQQLLYRSGSCLNKLALFEVGLNDDMFEILVQQGLVCPEKDGVSSHCTLRTLNLGRNLLTWKSVPNVTSLLQNQPTLESVTLSHNIELFRRTPTADRDSVSSEGQGAAPLGLTQRVSSDNQILNEFWDALHHHKHLLQFWALSPQDHFSSSNNNSNAVVFNVDERVKPILTRNQWLRHAQTKNLDPSLWPAALHACASHNAICHRAVLTYTFVRFRIEAWLTACGGSSQPQDVVSESTNGSNTQSLTKSEAKQVSATLPTFKISSILSRKVKTA